MRTAGQFPWYDGYWLDYYVRAKAFIGAHWPSRLQYFVESLAPLRTDPSFQPRHLEAVVDPVVLAQLREVVRALKPTQLELHEIKTFGRWVVHDHPIMTELQKRMTALAEEASGEALETSYNFLSMYTRLCKCPLHMDAPFAKWTLDICIDQSEPWPIHFSRVVPWPEDELFAGEDWEQVILQDARYEFAPHVMNPGDAIVFSGSSQWHYRDPMPASNSKSFCHLIFFHFFPRGMREFMDPAAWEDRFNAPGLSDALGNPAPEMIGQRG